MQSLEVFSSYSDVPMDVEAQIGRTTLTVRQILELAPGTIIPLNRSTGEHVDVFIGGAHVGQAEIVGTRDTSAIRIAQLREED